ncbi:MAG: Asp-tRNA(Asn)/Glu-tRNA(Gln) amidotransferase subunit GatA, partial [Phycisphaerae bacterium]
LHAFVTNYRDEALSLADGADAQFAAGHRVSALQGIPIAIKDNICTQGMQTSCGSKILSGFTSRYNAHVIERLLEADAIILGKTNMDEFAMGSSTENSAFGPARNPWNIDKVTGGSSGGSAAAVASGLAPAALGSDTGGSIRQPASFCGVTGLKPTYGRVSRYGLVAYGSSLDQIGPFARDVQDTALLLSVIAGADDRDSTCLDRPVPAYGDCFVDALTGIRVGVCEEYFSDGLDPEVRRCVEAAIDELLCLGATTVPVSIPHTEYANACYYIIAMAEASSNLARFDGVRYGHRSETAEDVAAMYTESRGEGLGEEVKRRIMLGTFALSSGYYDAYYDKALRVRTLIQQDFAAAFEQADVILSPVSPTPAFGLGENIEDPLQMYLNDIYTISANLAGNAAISIPCGFTSSGLPVGLQLTGPALGEEQIFRVAEVFQGNTSYHLESPPGIPSEYFDCE